MKRLLLNGLILALSTSLLSTAVVAAEELAQEIEIGADGQITGFTGVTTLSPPADAKPLPERKILYSVTQEDTTWKNGPASFPRGTSYTVLEGDPFAPGPYTIRIKFPPNYKLPAHAHGDSESITVISGVLHVALGDQLKEGDALVLPSGGFTLLSPKINHYVWTGKEGAVVQFHGEGPRALVYVDVKNDPTWKKQLQSGHQVADNQTAAPAKKLSTSLNNTAMKAAHYSAIHISLKEASKKRPLQLGHQLADNNIARPSKKLSVALKNIAMKTAHYSAMRLSLNDVLKKKSRHQVADNKIARPSKKISASLKNIAMKTAHYSAIHLSLNNTSKYPLVKKQHATTSHEIDAALSSHSDESHGKLPNNKIAKKKVAVADKMSRIPETELLLN